MAEAAGEDGAVLRVASAFHALDLQRRWLARMKVRLIDAMTLRDGGTTTVTIEVPGSAEARRFTVDYSLPWNGRTRFVYEVRPGKTREKLEIGGAREREAVDAVFRCVSEHFGESKAREYVERKSKCPETGKWLYAVNFLSILAREGRAI